VGDDLLELEPCRSPARPQGNGRRRSRKGITAALAVVALAVGIVSVVQGGAPATPEERVADVVAFARRADMVEFTIDYRVRRGGFNGAVLARTRSEGVVGSGDTARWRETDVLDGGGTEETIVLPEVVYRRSGHLWTAMAVEEADLELQAGSSAWALPESVQATPPFAWLRHGDFSRLVGSVGSVAAASDGTLLASRELADIYPVVPPGMVGQARIELTAGGNGRIDRLVLTVETPRDTLTASGQNRIPYETVTDIHFTRWNRAATVTAPPLSEVDRTPQIDEARIADVSWPLMAPTVLPEGFRLDAATFLDRPCEGVMLEYHGPPTTVNYGEGDLITGSPSLSITQRPCAEELSDDVFGPEMPFSAGPYAGVIRRHRHEPRAQVRLRIDGTVLVADSTLDDAALNAALASLGPLDFAAQPVVLDRAVK
jgi:hypothetical protein